MRIDIFHSAAINASCCLLCTQKLFVYGTAQSLVCWYFVHFIYYAYRYLFYFLTQNIILLVVANDNAAKNLLQAKFHLFLRWMEVYISFAIYGMLVFTLAINAKLSLKQHTIVAFVKMMSAAILCKSTNVMYDDILK